MRARDPQLDAREGQAGPSGVAERPVLAMKLGNSGGAKGPWFKVSARSGDSREIGVSLVPPIKVGKLQKALHAKAKRSPNYRLTTLRSMDVGSGWTNWRRRSERNGIAPQQSGGFSFPSRAKRGVPDRSGFRRSETVL